MSDDFGTADDFDSWQEILAIRTTILALWQTVLAIRQIWQEQTLAAARRYGFGTMDNFGTIWFYVSV